MLETVDTPCGVLPLNKEIVLQAIEKLNEVNHTWLMKFKETEKIVCVAPSEMRYDCEIYCEDNRLSLCRPGQEIRCVRPDRSDHFIALSSNDVDALFDMCLGFLNVEDVKVGKSSSMKSIRWEAMRSEPFRGVGVMFRNLAIAFKEHKAQPAQAA